MYALLFGGVCIIKCSMKIDKQNLKKAVIYLLGATATALGLLWGMTSCQVSRNITTTAESYNKGDTAIIIQTKTIETYTGTKK